MKYLEPSVFCESNSPEIRRLARRIVGKKKGRAAAVSIFNWVQKNVDYRIVPLVGASRILKRRPRKAMCLDKINLFVALCRAAGIPARYVIMKCDLKVKRKDLPKKAMHAAAEVKIKNRWVLADPSFSPRISKLIHVPGFGGRSWSKVHSVKRSHSLGRGMGLMINLFIRLDAKVLKKEIGQ
ncbi:MAG: transglutaminase family protein [Candidatus Aenigmatarchaeota archaeon]